MKHIALLFGLLLQISVLSAQDYFEQFQQLCGGEDHDLKAMFDLLQKWESAEPDNLDLKISYFNYYFTASHESAIVFKEELNEEELALKLEGEGGKNIFLGSQLFHKDKELGLAIDWINKGIEQAPQRLDLRFGKCHALGKAGKWENLVTEVGELLSYSYSNNHRWIWSDNESVSGANQIILDAIQDYNTMIYDVEDDTLLVYMRENSLHVLKHKPDHTISLSNVAITYMLNGDNGNAIIYLEKAVELDPEDAIILGNIAQIYYREKNYEKAKFYYNEVLKYGEDYLKDQAHHFLNQMD